MSREKKLLKTLFTISQISSDYKLPFRQRLNRLLLEVLDCMEATRGSVMLMKGRKSLEVVASTNPDIIGVTQALDSTSPSGWVVKEKKPLYVDGTTKGPAILTRKGKYQKSAFLVVPILRGTKVIGVLSITNKVGKDVFEKEEQEILFQIMGQVIGTLEMERLTTSLKSNRKTLAKKNKQLKKLERLRTDLFNMLIHDLKGPISEVVANLDILSYTVIDENRPFVEAAQTGCDTLDNMVSNLLDIARLEERKLDLIVEKILPEDLIRESVSRIFRVAQMKQITLEEDMPSQPPPRPLHGDRGVLLRVLQNLLTNAIHYSPSGESIRVGFDFDADARIRFSVEDNGPGVPPEYHHTIFNKFMQLEKKGDGRIYTTGLGLTFCKMAVEAHRGKIGVASGDVKGSQFWFSLPLEKGTL